MEKQSIIPPLPEPFVLTEELEADLKKWIEYLKNMSPRVVVKSCLDKDFIPNLKSYRDQFKVGLEASDDPKDIYISEWPEDRKIAFIVCFDSSFPGEKQRLLAKDGFVFCFGNFAFDLSNLEQSNESSGKAMFTYEFCDYGNPDIFLWKEKVGCLQFLLSRHAEQIPKLKVGKK